MKPLTRYTEEYFLGFKHLPVEIKPFDPKTKQVAQIYETKLDKLLEPLELESRLIGSTLFEIAGKGEIEFAIYAGEDDWVKAIKLLKECYGEAGRYEAEYVRFNDNFKGIEVEITLMKGHTARVSQQLHQYLLSNPKSLEEYLEVKNKHAHSKQEYVRHKHKFFKKIILELPEE